MIDIAKCYLKAHFILLYMQVYFICKFYEENIYTIEISGNTTIECRFKWRY